MSIVVSEIKKSKKAHMRGFCFRKKSMCPLKIFKKHMKEIEQIYL